MSNEQQSKRPVGEPVGSVVVGGTRCHIYRTEPVVPLLPGEHLTVDRPVIDPMVVCYALESAGWTTDLLYDPSDGELVFARSYEHDDHEDLTLAVAMYDSCGVAVEIEHVGEDGEPASDLDGRAVAGDDLRSWLTVGCEPASMPEDPVMSARPLPSALHDARDSLLLLRAGSILNPGHPPAYRAEIETGIRAVETAGRALAPAVGWAEATPAPSVWLVRCVDADLPGDETIEIWALAEAAIERADALAHEPDGSGLDPEPGTVGWRALGGELVPLWTVGERSVWVEPQDVRTGGA